MSNIVNFAGHNVPAHFRKNAVAALAADLTQGVSASYSVISIKGKTWAIVKSGERNVILDAEREPVRSIKVVLVKANPTVSKVYYSEGYSEGSDAKPTCYSNDNVQPAADSEAPQSKKCATCPHNQWGSATSRETGLASKGKACADSRRIAIAPADLKADPMLLRVPPASLKAVADYGRALADKGVPYNGVITKLSFDPDAASPKLILKFEGFLDEAGYEKVQELCDSEIVDQIIAKGPVPSGDGDAPQQPERAERFDDHDRQAAAAPQPEPAPAPAPKPRARKPAATPAPAPAPAPEGDDDLGVSSFGGEPEPAPAPVKTAPAPAAAEPEVTEAGDSLEDDLAAALGGFDD